MSAPLSTEPYKGVRDFYPTDWAHMDALFGVMRKVLRSYGYEEYNASPLERSELYESKGNEEIVNEQTYTFMDRGERSVTLRPEMTPTLARMVAAKRRELTFPLRWFSIPNVFRYERPQRGRLREHYQLNVDLLGIKDARADGEIITLAHGMLTAFGAKNEDFIIRVSSRTLLAAAGKALQLSDDAFKRYLGLLDKKAKMTPEAYAIARETISKEDPLELIEKKSDANVEKERAKLAALIDAFTARGMTNVVFDPGIVRGFDYYTGIIFEIFDTHPENPRALFGGGRYDGLVGMFGGEAIPAVGFGMGDVTFTDFLTTHGLLPKIKSAADIYLGTPSESDVAAAQTAAETLRAAGLSVLVNVTDRKLGDQIKEADKRGIGYFAAVGANEHTSGKLKVKKLSTGEERELPLNEIVSYVHS